MATNFVKQLLGDDDGEGEAETLAARQIEDPVVAGGLAGVLAGTVFGGPIGAAVGLATGLISQRARKNVIDRTSADLAANDRFSAHLFTQLQDALPFVQKYGSEIDKEQYGDIIKSVERFSELANHHDPSVRGAALSSLIATDGRFEAWRQDIETRNRAVVDRDYELRVARAKEIKDEFDTLRSATEESEIEADAAMTMLNDLGVDNPVVQSRLRQLANFTMKEAQEQGASVSVAPFGLGFGFNVGEYKFNYDEAIKLITGFRKSTTSRRYDRMQQLAKEALSDGFQPNLRDGEVVVEDLNIYSTTTPRVESRGNPNPPDPNVDPDSASEIVRRAVTSPIIEPSTYDKIREKVEEAANHAINHSWILRHTVGRDKKRPTN